MKKLLVILVALTAGLTATAQKSTVNCTFKGLESGARIVLSNAQGGRLVPVDTLTPNAKGLVSITRPVADPTMMILSLNKSNSPMLHLLVMPKEKITLTVDYMPATNQFNITSSKGSDNMRVYKEFTNLLVRTRLWTPEIPFEQSLDSLLSANTSTLMSAFLVTYFEQAFEQYAPLYKKIRDGLIDKWPENEFVKHVDSRVRTALVAGMEAPDIVMADRNGNTRRLSDLRGKVVLIDFWASWCRPCRMENPNVVRLYSQFHNKGFEVFSVSLDNNRDAWLKAIEDDHLSWPNHVSDLRGWSSAAGRLYGIQSIPATVLVAPDGKIMARNLRGKDLENKLKEIFAQ
ncbi:MAG: AhpC/TSA family protein [Bacteroidales bacterium]|nr:AhpC/TSA family protein [Bacteroidales bacterium]